MASNKDSFGRTVGFIFALCLVCSIIVAGAAVGLKDTQMQKKMLDKQTKVLETAGLLAKVGNKPKAVVEAYNKYVEEKFVDLNSGKLLDEEVGMYDQRKASRDLSQSIKPQNDIAKILRRANKTVIYLVKNEQGQVDTVILPIRGSGLWSMMYAFVGLDTDLNTIKSVVYYEQGETPGLGGEVENPKWKALWPGKKLFDEQGQLAIKIVKGGAAKDDIHGVDGLSGATLTSLGVQKQFEFWFGNEGYAKFIQNYKNGGLTNG
jgi:Na+-transporting NADH:ubiquinone oxidoreductase subunit C